MRGRWLRAAVIVPYHRNTGAAWSSGTVLCFLDADDKYYPEHIAQTGVQFARQAPLRLAYVRTHMHIEGVEREGMMAGSCAVTEEGANPAHPRLAPRLGGDRAHKPVHVARSVFLHRGLPAPCTLAWECRSRAHAPLTVAVPLCLPADFSPRLRGCVPERGHSHLPDAVSRPRRAVGAGHHGSVPAAARESPGQAAATRVGPAWRRHASQPEASRAHAPALCPASFASRWHSAMRTSRKRTCGRWRRLCVSTRVRSDTPRGMGAAFTQRCAEYLLRKAEVLRLLEDAAGVRVFSDTMALPHPLDMLRGRRVAP